MIAHKGRGLGDLHEQYLEQFHPIATIEYKKKLYQLIPFRRKYKHYNNPGDIFWRLYQPENLNLIMSTTPFIEFYNFRLEGNPVTKKLFRELQTACKIQLKNGVLDHEVRDKGIIFYPSVLVIDQKHKYQMRFYLAYYRGNKSKRYIYLGWGFAPNIKSNKRIFMHYSKFAWKNFKFPS
jgi:hypothetical protein